ncbi:MAG: TonB-dependent receptor [Gammaproteobacteria bacterium]|nr:TonB-dependent receptor [Gammaproteobacteria bacterium]
MGSTVVVIASSPRHGRGASRWLVAIVLPALCSPAFADDATGPAAGASTTAPVSEKDLAEVVVTAEKRESTVQETPISISALSAAQLQNENITSLEDLAGAVPGVSMRTAGPGQTEYEMRGLTSAGGSTATVGFYIDETPLSASAVALNGRTVIDPDLFDLNHVEVLRGPQGTLYGAGSMGGTIKLVTNKPKLGEFEAATDLNVSHTESGGSVNGGGSGMVNVPLGDIAALRIVGTEKYISGWIDRVVIPNFPFPTDPYGSAGAPSNCVTYYCNRGDVQNATPSKIIHGSNLERFASARAILLVKPNDQLSVTTTLMYQRIDAAGYNNYQATGTSPAPYPTHPGIYQPYDQPEPYYDQFKLASMTLVYDFGPASVTLTPAYWQRFVRQTTDSTEALQNINNLTTFIQSLYSETDPTTQDSIELRLASNGTGPWQWQGGVYGADLHSGYITHNQNLPFATALTCGYPTSTSPVVGGSCPASQQYNPNSVLRYPDANLPPYASGEAANPNGIVFNDNNPNIMKQYAVFGEASYKLLDDLKLTAGIRYFKYTIENHADQAGLGTAAANQDHTLLNVHQSGSAVLPKLNLSYTPTPDLTVYGTVAKGARPGGVNLPIPIPTIQQLEANPGAYNCNVPLANQLDPTLPAPPGAYVSKQPSYGPDEVWSYELGEKSRFDDRRFTFDADVYYIKWSKIQQVVSLTCGYPFNTNAGNARAYGPEVETSMRVTDGLTLSVSGAYTKAQINDPSAAAQAAGFTPGIKIINVPEYTAVAALDYQQPINDKLAAVFHLSSSLIGPIEDQAYYREKLPSHNLVDLKAGVVARQWAAYITATNLTNKLAALTIDNTVFAWQQPTITRVSTNQPRTIGIDVTCKF